MAYAKVNSIILRIILVNTNVNKVKNICRSVKYVSDNVLNVVLQQVTNLKVVVF